MNLSHIRLSSLITLITLLLTACSQPVPPQTFNEPTVSAQSVIAISGRNSCVSAGGAFTGLPDLICTFNDNYTLNAGDTLTLTGGPGIQKLVFSKGLTNDGTMNFDIASVSVAGISLNNGTINVSRAGFENNGTFTNKGFVNIISPARLTNNSTFTNEGTLTIGCRSVWVNNGTYNGTPPQTECPSVSLNKASGQADPTSTGPLQFTAVFSEDVTGFTDSDVVLSGTAGASTASVTGGPRTYSIAVSGMTSNGTVIASIPANAVSDLEGNPNTASTSTDNSITFVSDIIAPSANPGQTPIGGNAGWNNSDVTVNWNWSDAGSGIDTTNCTTSSTSSREGSIKLSATCKDNAGNQGSADYTVKVDKTAPTISAAATTAPNANGWYNGNVTIHFTCADALSGVASCPADQVLSSEGSAVSSTAVTAKDVAGNTSTPSNVVAVKIDKTVPTISLASRLPAANANGWNNSDVTVIWNCTDAASGPANPTVSQVVTTAGANQSATQTCTDLAGNSASNTQSGISIDKIAPTVSGTVSPNPVIKNLSATATPSASDAVSGVASKSCAIPSTASVGNFTVACTATDKAGNVGNGTASYSVISASSASGNLITQVKSLNLGNLQNPLVVKLQAAQADLAVGNTAQAISDLNDFINQVNAKRGKGITTSQADSLIAAANQIIQSIQGGI